MLSSDKTLLTNKSGDKNAHCVYMSCGNIQKEVRSKASARCWVKIAEIPVPKFDEKHLQAELTQRIYHLCMDIIPETLKQCSHTPVWMTDANGDKRLVRTILLAHLADLPEQLLIACCHQGASPLSLARTKDFGSSEKQPPRTGIGTRQCIRDITATTSPKSIRHYNTRASKFGMNSVNKPYWRDWKFADPSKFLAPDALHQWHKFFWAHVMKWARKLIGDKELDRRYQCLQKHVQHRHFSNGFTSLSQQTCREDRDLEASFIAVISGHPKITSGVMAAFRAMLDFIYLGQLETHTTETLKQLRASLAAFHENKKHLVAAGIRNGPKQKGEFNIPKLELMHHIADFVESLGSVLQYTTEHTERCHITLAKQPYRTTNKKKGYEVQVCLELDRRDKIDLFATYLEWKAREGAGHGGHIAPAARTPAQVPNINASNWQLRSERFLSFARAFIPQPPRDAFRDHPSVTPRNDTTAFILNDRITHGDATVGRIMRIYRLPKLRDAIVDYYEQQYDLEEGIRIKFLDCWDRVRLQLRSSLHHSIGVMPPVPVMASARTPKLPLGLCNFVLVKEIPGLGVVCLQGT